MLGRPCPTSHLLKAPVRTTPFALTTGRTVYHFHTQPNTGRAPELEQAAREARAEVNAADAARHGVHTGDVVEMASPRSAITATVRVGGIRPGVLFVPFHCGYWDVDEHSGHHSAANELTITDWDGVEAADLRDGSSVAHAPRARVTRPTVRRTMGHGTRGGLPNCWLIARVRLLPTRLTNARQVAGSRAIDP